MNQRCGGKDFNFQGPSFAETNGYFMTNITGYLLKMLSIIWLYHINRHRFPHWTVPDFTSCIAYRLYCIARQGKLGKPIKQDESNAYSILKFSQSIRLIIQLTNGLNEIFKTHIVWEWAFMIAE